MKIFLVSLFFAIVFSSCSEDILDKKPLDSLSIATFWQTEDDAMAALMDCYDGWESYWNLYWMDGVTDNIYSTYFWDGVTNYGNGSITPDIVGTYDGRNFYTYIQIRKYNNFLENIDNIDMDIDDKKQMIAEVRFLRAYDYFWKIQLYGDVPLVTEVLSMDEITNERTPRASVAQFIFDELNLAIPDLEAMYPATNGRISKAAALALKARFELFEGDFSEAHKTAGLIMEMDYELHPDFSDLFYPTTKESKEIILSTQHIKDDYNSNLRGYCLPKEVGGWASITPTQSLVDAFEMDDGSLITDEDASYDPSNPWINRDPRLKATVLCPGDTIVPGLIFNPLDLEIAGNKNDYHHTIFGGTQTGYYPVKYMGFGYDMSDVWNSEENFIVFRFAEVLLTYAEAKIEDGQIDASVYAALDELRSRAGMPPVDRTKYNNQASLRELVRRERRVELACEGLRWFDIKRWDIGQDVISGDLLGCRKGTVIGGVNLDGEHIFVEQRVFYPDRNYLWPIPQSEVDAVGTRQNDGY